MPVHETCSKLHDLHRLLNFKLIARELGVNIPPDECLIRASGSENASDQEWKMVRNAAWDMFMAMERLFPINEMWAETVAYEEGFPPPYIPIGLEGVCSNWDEFEELLCDPGIVSPNMSSVMFALWLTREVEPSAWDAGAYAFGWSMNEQPDGTRGQVNTDKLAALLDEAGLSDFKAAFLIAMNDTGVQFFDLDDYAFQRGYAPDFSLAEMHKLQEEWRIGREMERQALHASEMANQQPAIYEKLVKLYRSASS